MKQGTPRQSERTIRDELETYLRDYQWREIGPLPGRTNHIRCGVLLPLCLSNNLLLCYAGKRSSTLQKHAGEICFPGGRPEACDPTLVATALREANEEMGITNVSVLGRLSSMPLYSSDYRLEPYVGVIEDSELQPDGREIIEICPIDLREVLARPCINAIPYQGDWHEFDEDHLSPVFEVGDHLMFGATAYVFFEFLEIIAEILGSPLPPTVVSSYQWADLLP